MSGIGFWELIVLFVIGLLILGPERLPRVATQIGRWVGRARRTANQLRFQLEREIALADIEKKSTDRRDTAKKPPASTESQADETASETRAPGETTSSDEGASSGETISSADRASSGQTGATGTPSESVREAVESADSVAGPAGKQGD